MIRKLLATFGMTSLAVLVAAADPASAKVITGTPENDALTGTPVADRIHGLAGDDDITGHKGDDWLFGDEGFDFFHWANGDGHDRIDGGDDVDSLSIDMGKRLNLHVGAIGAEQPTATKGKLQQISIKDIDFIEIVGTEKKDRLLLSSDRGIEFPSIYTGAGDDDIDLRKAQVANQPPDGLLFSSVVYAGDDDDTIWTGEGSWTIFGQAGENEIHLGRARNILYYEEGEDRPHHDTAFSFGQDDFIVSTDFIFDGSQLDTNGDRRLDAKDKTVTIRHGDMTIDLSSGSDGVPPGTITLTLIGRVRLSLRQIRDNSD